jgi:hypothetical protein
MLVSLPSQTPAQSELGSDRKCVSVQRLGKHLARPPISDRGPQDRVEGPLSLELMAPLLPRRGRASTVISRNEDILSTSTSRKEIVCVIAKRVVVEAPLRRRGKISGEVVFRCSYPFICRRGAARCAEGTGTHCPCALMRLSPRQQLVGGPGRAMLGWHQHRIQL